MSNDLRDEVMSGDFPAYRKAEIEVAARFVHGMFHDSNEYTRGAMDMFRNILNIPAGCARTDEQKAFISRRMAVDFALFETEYLRKAVRDE